jgi:hypothetical protein
MALGSRICGEGSERSGTFTTHTGGRRVSRIVSDAFWRRNVRMHGYSHGLNVQKPVHKVKVRFDPEG